MQQIITDYKKSIFGITLVLKVILCALFSSGYQETLFYPFVQHFLTHLGNPWQHFHAIGVTKAFPYPPLMLYLLSIGGWLPVALQGAMPDVLRNVFFKLPTLAADLLIFYLLIKTFPARKTEVLIFYFLSPIVIYSSFIHSQLDLIPTSLLLLAVYQFIHNRTFLGGLVMGLSMSVKFHVVAALPLLLVYLIKNKKNPTWAIALPPAVYLGFAAPYLLSSGYINMVLNNAEQRQIFSVFLNFDTLKLYLAPLACLIIYGRFLAYQKINKDLLLSTLGLLFSVFIFLVPPMPAWYIWVLPFIAISLINIDAKNRQIAYLLNGALSVTYLAYFLFFHRSAFTDVLLFGQAVPLKVTSPHLQSLAFTVLEGTLLATIYFLYKFGIKSNLVYKQKDRAFVIGIGGDSGAGKSTLAGQIKAMLTPGSVLELEGDGDHRWERGDQNWTRYTHLNPKANFLHRQSDNLIALKQGSLVQRVDYDHHTGRFTTPQTISAGQFILMCGLHPFYLPKMRKAIDLKIYLETDETLRRHWKVCRDTHVRGYSTEKVLTQIESRVEDATKYIQPQKQYADLIIRYVTNDAFLIGDKDASPQINLELTIDSNIHLDLMLEQLQQAGVHLLHDYSDDMKAQHLVASTRALEADYESIVDACIENREEVLPPGGEWYPDHRGLIQLVILVMISEKMKEVANEA